MTRKPVGLVLVALALVAAATLAASIRARVGLSSDHWFLYDTALHYRMTLLAEAGRLGAVDHLRYHPEGAVLAELEPTGLYALGRLADRSLTPLTGDVVSSLRWFVVLSASLIVLPAYFLSRLAWGSRTAGVVAALAIAVDPAHVMRTVASLYRFDAPGITLIASHALFAFLALRSHGRRAIGFSITAGATLFLLLTLWRVGVGVMTLEVYVLTLVLLGGGHRSGTLLASLAGAFLLAGVLPYFRAQHVLVSRAALPALWAACVGAVVAGWTARRALRSRCLVVGALWLSAALLRAFLPSAPFDDLEGTSVRAILALHDIGRADPFLTMLYGTIQELAMPRFFLLPGGSFSWLGPLALIGLATGLWVRTRFRLTSSEANAWLASMGLAWVVASALVARASGLASVSIAVACGGLGTLLPAAFGRDGARSGRLAGGAGLLVVLACALGAAVASVRLLAAYPTDADGSTREVCRYISERVPSGSAILTDWGLGYTVQTYGGRPTLTDGHLEHPRNRARILAISRAMAGKDAGAFLQLCGQLDARYVLLHAGYNGLPFLYTGLAGKISKSGSVALPKDATESVSFRLFENPASIPGVVELFRTGPFRLLEINASG